MSKSIHQVISQSESVDLVTCHGFCFEFPTKFFRHKDGVVNGNGVTFLAINDFRTVLQPSQLIFFFSGQLAIISLDLVAKGFF